MTGTSISRKFDARAYIRQYGGAEVSPLQNK
jgi:hypothetical protein